MVLGGRVFDAGAVTPANRNQPRPLTPTEIPRNALLETRECLPLLRREFRLLHRKSSRAPALKFILASSTAALNSPVRRP